MASLWKEHPQYDETLKQLHAAGLSCSLIARTMSRLGHAFTKNGIIGRINRIGLPKRSNKPTKQLPNPSHKRKIISAAALPERVRQLRMRTVVADIPAPTCFIGKSLIELEPGDCRYPEGNLNITFCAQPKLKDSPYCQKHHRLCYTGFRT